MKILTIKKFNNAEENEFTYGLYDNGEELYSCISTNDAEAKAELTEPFRVKELDERYGKGNWKIGA